MWKAGEAFRRRSADSREEREWEGPGFHQMQDLRRASPNRVSTQGVLFHPLNECEERNRSRGIRDCGRDSSPQQKIPHLQQNGKFFFNEIHLDLFSLFICADVVLNQICVAQRLQG